MHCHTMYTYLLPYTTCTVQVHVAVIPASAESDAYASVHRMMPYLYVCRNVDIPYIGFHEVLYVRTNCTHQTWTHETHAKEYRVASS